MRKWLTRYIIPLLLVLWIVLLLSSAGLAAQPALTITGTGLHHDVQISGNGWSKYSLEDRFYSSSNNFNYHKIWKVKGYDIFNLIGDGNLKTDQNYAVVFISALDGGKVTKTVSELQSQYYHPKFTASGAVPVAPMLSFYRTAVFEPDYQGLPESTEVIWQDRALTENDSDGDKPRLVMGQSLGQVSQNNQSFFNKQVARIVVGEERPVEEPPTEENTDSTKKPGESTPGKEETKPSSPGSPDAKDEPEKEKVPGSDAKEGEAADKDNGDSELDKGTDEEAENGEKDEDEMAAAPDEEDNALTGEEIDEKPRKPRWPWIAAGAVIVAGLAGGGIYYYIRRRGA